MTTPQSRTQDELADGAPTSDEKSTSQSRRSSKKRPKPKRKPSDSSAMVDSTSRRESLPADTERPRKPSIKKHRSRGRRKSLDEQCHLGDVETGEFPSASGPTQKASGSGRRRTKIGRRNSMVEVKSSSRRHSQGAISTNASETFVDDPSPNDTTEPSSSSGRYRRRNSIVEHKPSSSNRRHGAIRVDGRSRETFVDDDVPLAQDDCASSNSEPVPAAPDPTLYEVEAQLVPPPPSETGAPTVWTAEAVTVAKSGTSRRRLIFVVLFIFVAAAVTVLVAFLGTGQTGDPITLAPTSSPSFSSDDSMISFLTSFGVDSSTFRDVESPQSQALDWLTDPEFNRKLTATFDTIQRYVLAVMYFTTNGTEWANSDGWLTAASVCEWFTAGSIRTVCSDDGLLTQLNLSRNNLGGQLPSEISLLADQLFVFDVRFNKLTGTIPPELGKLSLSEIFYVEANKLTGTVPSELGELKSATNLYLNDNNLTGTIPPQVCALKNRSLKLFWGDCDDFSNHCFSRCCSDGDQCSA